MYRRRCSVLHATSYIYGGSWRRDGREARKTPRDRRGTVQSGNQPRMSGMSGPDRYGMCDVHTCERDGDRLRVPNQPEHRRLAP